MGVALTETVRLILETDASTFDWGLFLDQASRQRVIGLVAANLDRYGLMMADGGGVPAIPSQHRWLLRAAYLAIKARNRALLDELRVILEQLSDTGIRVVVRKGGYLTSLLYGDLGMRRLGDLDLLAEPGEATQAITGCLQELGYSQGTVSLNGRRVQPMSRRLHVHWALKVNSLPPFVRPTSDPCVDQFYVDVRTALSDPSWDFDIPTSDLVSRAQVLVIDGLNVPVPSVEDGLIDLCVHLFREATLIYYIEAGKDLTLMKFCDIAAYLDRFTGELDETEFVASVRRYRIERPIYYALYFTDLLYPGAVPPSLLKTCTPEDTAFLDEYGVQEQQPARWRQDFLTRLFDSRRQWMHTGHSTMPKEPRS